MHHTTGVNQNSELAAGNRRVSVPLSANKTVCVQLPKGKPLNPCHPARARELIKKKRAVRICRHPYTIRLKAETLSESLRLLSEQEAP
ncbi:RRXRR domain-containing protein [Methylomonas sp. AM2-LC]|uniref:RRXRR domain-containing protein n=1 Tax=Methylomonas sp. AM2-LC TaxID=3153301 RepID=UPI003267A755